MGRPKVHDSALQLKLLDRAVEVLSSTGPEGLSLRRLAADVETSTTAVYSLFGSKPRLLERVKEEALRRFATHLDAVEPTGDPREDLLGLANAYRASAIANPHYYRVLFDTAPHPEHFGTSIMGLYAETFGLLVTGVERCMAAGQLARRDPAYVAHALWAYVHGLVLLELNGFVGSFAPDPAGNFETAIRLATDGWAT